jgi:AcrR family transcriptional regulator
LIPNRAEISAEPMLLIENRPATMVQIDKYNLILASAVELADSGGYDAVQMRAVAESSGVALATIYRYFGSRNYLAFVMTSRWFARVVADARTVASPHTESLDDLIGQIHASAKMLEAHPRMLETWARATLNAPPEMVKDRSRWMDTSITGIPPARDVNPEDWAQMLSLMETVYWSGIVRWAHGHKAYDEIAGDVAEMAIVCSRALRLFAE